MSRTALPLFPLPARPNGDSLPVGNGRGLIDTFGRRHTHLRISVTDRCNLRCTYCMPEEVVFRDRSELLTFEEIVRFTTVAVSLGIDKIRLTGGEPLMRRGLPDLVEALHAIPGLTDIGLTTNGLLLPEQAEALRAAGLSRLNISLDTLDAGRFRELARRDGLNRVLAGIDAAKSAGFDRIKINAVSLRGFAELDTLPLARFCRERDLELRFIESMPIGAEPWNRESVFSAAEILELIDGEFGPSQSVPDQDPSAPATEYVYGDGLGRFGIIASITRPFCGACNRVRLTAEGKLRNCLFALDETDVKSLLRDNTPDEEIARVIRQSVHDKWEGHEINTARFLKPARTMHAIGG
ncbi:GTP 3',8-cyclase MoaA [Zavarzinella formosa]|uniref:GTP 3',8-cyclase MoaA n=1 Tax=Zavarzinella formosa TaxID=360055 RepID=UPI0002DBC804|nr:GTP 3',8-cyclase MoaA [Zavarzinella formosa]